MGDRDMDTDENERERERVCMHDYINTQVCMNVYMYKYIYRQVCLPLQPPEHSSTTTRQLPEHAGRRAQQVRARLVTVRHDLPPTPGLPSRLPRPPAPPVGIFSCPGPQQSA
jgi:hypothetical protein